MLSNQGLALLTLELPFQFGWKPKALLNPWKSVANKFMWQKIIRLTERKKLTLPEVILHAMRLHSPDHSLSPVAAANIKLDRSSTLPSCFSLHFDSIQSKTSQIKYFIRLAKQKQNLLGLAEIRTVNGWKYIATFKRLMAMHVWMRQSNTGTTMPHSWNPISKEKQNMHIC